MARINLATTVNGRGRLDEALALLDEALAADPDNLVTLSVKGKLLVDGRRLPEALAVHEDLLARVPDDSVRWLNYAYLLKTMGRLEDSVAAYRKSLSLDPANGAAWWGLANLKTVRFGMDDVEAMRAVLPSPQQDDANRIHLHFSLGKALGDQARYEESFAHYAEGNRLRRAGIDYSPATVTQDVATAEAVFTPGYFEQRAGQGAPAPDPIFIVSLPRSGSTLVEQILASHPMVEGTEELFDIQNLAGRVAGAKGQGPLWQDNLPHLSANELRALGESYLATTRPRRQTDRPFFTDKMPGNWAYLGLIRTILPNAKIVDVRRHPLGCGFANFTQFFTRGVDFSYDLAEIGLHYRDYVRLMDHFDQALPGAVHHVRYEDLVENLEREVRRLLDYLGLPFDEACLRFHENERAVHTPSAQQVRRPINRQGMETWRNYEPWLGPLKTALGPVLD
jgi:tetratricopeptide (TPR) repeat protein